MIGMLRRLIAVFMTLFAFFPWEATAVSPMQAEQPDAVRLNVSILSDGHMEGNNRTRFVNHANAFRDISGAETPVDAAVFVGDNTMNGMEVEYLILYGLMKRYLTVENVLIAPGNHELCKDCLLYTSDAADE